MQESLVFLGNPKKLQTNPPGPGLAVSLHLRNRCATQSLRLRWVFQPQDLPIRGRRKGRRGQLPRHRIRHIYHDNPKGTTPPMPTLPKMEGLSTTIIYTLQVLALGADFHECHECHGKSHRLFLEFHMFLVDLWIFLSRFSKKVPVL